MNVMNFFSFVIMILQVLTLLFQLITQILQSKNFLESTLFHQVILSLLFQQTSERREILLKVSCLI